MMTTAERITQEYERALMVLNSTQLDYNFGHLDTLKTKKIDLTLNCIDRVGLAEDVGKLSIIHVAGTKGKGSTCAFVDSLLRKHGYKTGLFSSPHLIEARERIRINGLPADKELFTTSFWAVYDKLQATRASNENLMPGYFGITLVMAFHMFIKEKVDAVILEVGIGGEFDATNCIQNPAACAVTSLHLEHTDQLGNTIEEISWHKSGIMKKGVPLITMEHKKSVMDIMLDRSKARECPLFIARPLDPLVFGALELGLAGSHQYQNAAIAVQLFRHWQDRKKQGDAPVKVVHMDIQDSKAIPAVEIINLTQKEKEGLRDVRLPGRNQVERRQGVTYYLDGAHTTESMQKCVDWFKEEAKKEQEKIGGNVVQALVFRMKKTKSSLDHLKYLMDLGFTRAAFCPHVVSLSDRESYKDSMDLREDPAKAKEIADAQKEEWQFLRETCLQGSKNPCEPACFPSTVSALWWAGFGKDQSLKPLASADLDLLLGSGDGPENVSVAQVAGEGRASHVQVLVTGSLIMVGGALSLIKPDLWS